MIRNTAAARQRSSWVQGPRRFSITNGEAGNKHAIAELRDMFGDDCRVVIATESQPASPNTSAHFFSRFIAAIRAFATCSQT